MEQSVNLKKVNLTIPEKLHAKLKAFSAIRRKSMQEVIIDLLKLNIK